MPAGTVSLRPIDWNGDGTVDRPSQRPSVGPFDHPYAASGTYFHCSDGDGPTSGRQ